MRLAKVHSVALVGVHGTVVDIEVHIGGMPGFTLIGLPDASLYESRDRVRAAVLSSGEEWPLRKITASLSPAALPKRGSHFDLGLAVAILAADERIHPAAVEGVVFLGEVGLDGRLRAVPGVLPAVVAAFRAGLNRVIVPEANAGEARLVPGVAVLGARSLRQVVAFLRDDPIPVEDTEDAADPDDADGSQLQSPLQTVPTTLDMADVAGQPEAKQAVEIAAAGHHHIQMSGPPGAGKTMLAQRLPGLLPDLSMDAALEVSAIHSVAGALPGDRPLIVRPPFADPHHTASAVSIVGGGSRIIRPGAASLAHLGVLFLDEAPEFPPKVLDSLRQPLESGEISVRRAEATAVFPARFLLALARNPCPCGFSNVAGYACECKPDTVRRYRTRISGPVIDRIDVQIDLALPSMADINDGLQSAESTKVIADRVAAARARQERRLDGTPWRTNGSVPGVYLRSELKLPASVTAPIYERLRNGNSTIRGVDRTLRVAWTIADLAGHDRPTRDDAELAVQLRGSGSGRG